MARDWIRLPSFSSKEEAELVAPEGWHTFQIEELYEQLPVGKRFDQKTSLFTGQVPILDQSASGVVGWHNETPGVIASPETPVVTFANHTCEMRLMEEPFSVIQNVFPLIGKQGICRTRFLYYLTKGRVWLEEYKGHFPDFRRKWICCPPDSVQGWIERVLGDLDAKIDLNYGINQTLEAMAQAIFKSWFVDFDPVKAKIAAKAEGRDPLRAAMTAISGKPDAELDTLPPDQFTPLAASAALFPDEMEDSELGKIPKGWQVNKVGQLLELAYGKALKATDRVDGPIPVYGSGGVTGSHNAALVNHGSVIVGRKGTVGALYWEDGPFFPIDTTFYMRPFDAPMTYCFYLLQTLGLDKMNTDAAVPGLNRENVYRLEHVLPSSKALEAFDSTVGLLRSAMRANAASSKSLSVLRDTLLPKLLSGELQVHNTEAEAAA